ncbi:MAG: hypothetical protein KAV87_59040 [Desulfobacteraceae bacterium]|jgi:hypothetical protein|nr:hypothetical protein [Desulfobacteraceae bacterium]
MKDSTALPKLHLLPTRLLVTHEDSDPRRVDRFCERLRQEGHLKHPPIVSAIPGTDRYVVLDGANRTNSLLQLDIPHVVVQLISYGDPGVELYTWHHVVAGIEMDEFEEALARIPEFKLQTCNLEEARDALSTNRAVAYIICESGVRKVCSSENQMVCDINLLNKIVNVYRGQANIFRASNDIWEIQKPYYAEITALVVFPRLTPSDIMIAAREGRKVPSGITRHIIPARALNINIPLSVLDADWTIEYKREWLHDWLMERMNANAIRYYSESTFTFDE